jgi:hypothetical protein
MAAKVLFFFAVSVAQTLIGLLVFSYAAYSFFVVSVSTAAGNDEVVWPGDPIQDWLGNAWYLGWLLAVWAVPASFLATAVETRGWLVPATVVGILWLIFPISVLSSLSAVSKFVILRPTILWLMLRHAGATFVFYTSTAILLGLCAGLFYLGLTGSPLLIPVAAIVGAAGFLIYSRLLGRLGWLITRESPSTRSKGSPEVRTQVFDPWSSPDEEPQGSLGRSRSRKGRKKRSRTKRLVRTRDPWAVAPEELRTVTTKRETAQPELAEDPLGPARGVYEVHQEPSPTSAIKPEMIEPEPEPYAVSPAEEKKPSSIPLAATESLARIEARLAAPRAEPPPPSIPLVSGVYTFPFYKATLGPAATLSFGVLIVTALLRVQMAFWPL